MAVSIPGRSAVARASGRAAGMVSRRLGRGGGTTLPGVVARFVEPGVAAGLAGRLAQGAVVVSGTNGKTTTTRLLSAMLAASGRRVVHNRAGANLMSGVTTALLEQRGAVGLFEVDEATIPAAIRELRPRLVLCLNLFRDQLDRYGELNTLAAKWSTALGELPPDATALLNADDPLMANLGASLPCRVEYFGLDSPDQALSAMEHAADSLYCPRCSALLAFEAVYYGHLGVYRCPSCGWSRPAPHYAAHTVNLAADGPTRFEVRDLCLETSLPGLYNVYNVLAASAAALTLGVTADIVRRTVAEFGGAFGRTELVEMDGKRLRLLLAKNPVGYNEVIRTLLLDLRPLHLYLALNDRIADGQDVSWIWDVDFELLAGRVATVLAGGDRAEDLAVRLKYAGLAPEQIHIVKDHSAAVRQLLAATPKGAAAYAVPTYTAMLDLRQSLAEGGVVRPFWDD
ncbi:MAG: Mur ligase family protein [Chloroflexi bacterium]|nr:Mur ligase family protein [Chloroflexota bacterium]